LASFFVLALVLVFFRYSSGYFTPDERLFIFDYFLHEELSLKYVISSFIFRSLYQAFGVFGIAIFNLVLVSILCLWASKSSVSHGNNRLSLLVLSSLALPQVTFYAVTFLRDFHIYFLALVFLIARIKLSLIISLLSVFLIAILKPELAVIVIAALIGARLFKNSLWLLALIFTFVLISASLIYVPLFSDFFLERVVRFESTYLNGEELITLFLVSPVDNPFLAVVFLILNFFAFHVPYLFDVNISVFYLLMTSGNFIYIFVILLAIFGFNKRRYQADFLYRLCCFVFILSFLYSLIMVSPSTAQRMSIHFVPFVYYIFYFRRRFRIFN